MRPERLAEIQRDLERGGDAAQWPTAAVRELMAEIERLRGRLGELEWAGSTGYGSPQEPEPEWCCPACYTIKGHLHGADCWLAAELREQA